MGSLPSWSTSTLIVGQHGSGKTHLLRSLSSFFQHSPSAFKAPKTFDSPQERPLHVENDKYGRTKPSGEVKGNDIPLGDDSGREKQTNKAHEEQKSWFSEEEIVKKNEWSARQEFFGDESDKSAGVSGRGSRGYASAGGADGASSRGLIENEAKVFHENEWSERQEFFDGRKAMSMDGLGQCRDGVAGVSDASLRRSSTKDGAFEIVNKHKFSGGNATFVEECSSSLRGKRPYSANDKPTLESTNKSNDMPSLSDDAIEQAIRALSLEPSIVEANDAMRLLSLEAFIADSSNAARASSLESSNAEPSDTSLEQAMQALRLESTGLPSDYYIQSINPNEIDSVVWDKLPQSQGAFDLSDSDFTSLCLDDSRRNSKQRVYWHDPTNDLQTIVRLIDSTLNCVIFDDFEFALKSSDRACVSIGRALSRATKRKCLVFAAISSFEADAQTSNVLGRFPTKFILRAPNLEQRIQQIRSSLVTTPKFDSAWIAQRTGGWSRAELDALCRELMASEDSPYAVLNRLRRNVGLYKESWAVRSPLDNDATNDNATQFRPVHLGGMTQICETLDMLTCEFLNMSTDSTMRRVGTRGILLHGPSGNGKTALALALGHYVEQRGLGNFVSVRCTDLVSKVVGETENNICSVFRRARDCAPCVVFMDQIEAIAPKRTEESDTTERTFERTLTVLLVEMDGILCKSQNDDAPVVVVAATQHLHSLDAAMIRPGRFGTHVAVLPPNNELEVVDVFRACTRSMPIQVREDYVLKLAKRWLGKSRAVIAGLCREAAMAALRESLDSEHVCERHFDVALAQHL